MEYGAHSKMLQERIVINQIPGIPRRCRWKSEIAKSFILPKPLEEFCTAGRESKVFPNDKIVVRFPCLSKGMGIKTKINSINERLTVNVRISRITESTARFAFHPNNRKA